LETVTGKIKKGHARLKIKWVLKKEVVRKLGGPRADFSGFEPYCAGGEQEDDSVLAYGAV
jgi:hypothetical protein